MNQLSKARWVFFLLLFLAGKTTFAQTKQSFSLTEAIQFATDKNLNVQNSRLDATSADARIRELKGVALPQVNIGGSFLDNLIIQRAFLPATFFDRNASPDAPAVPVQFGVKYSSNLAASVNQLLYDAAYKVGLRAADTYRELAQKNIQASKITVAEQVAKAYYGVLVAEERAKLLNLNIGRLDTLLRETQALNNQGFVEKLDVQRLEVQSNNLKAESQRVQNLIGLSYALLKFQMGLGVDEEIQLTDRIQIQSIDDLQRSVALPATVDYTNRIEYSLLQTQLKLADLDIQSTQKSYYPRVAASFNYGYNSGRNKFSQLFTNPWLNFSTIGFNVSAPVFDGFTRKYQLQQKRVTLQKAQNSGQLVKNSIDLQVKQANITLGNQIETLRTQQRNRDLAQEIVRVTRIKYKEGVGSNIEVLNAETSFREAQTNYFASLYDFLLAKVDQDKATGKLFYGQN